MGEKINESKVKALAAKPVEAVEKHWDGDQKGFGVKLRPGGGLTFILFYRSASGTKREMKLGSWPAMSAAQARKLAEDTLAKVALGQDPCLDRRASRVRGMTVADLIDRYLADPTLKLKASSRQDVERTLRNHVVPVLGRSEVEAVDGPAIKRLASEVATGRTKADRKTERRRGRSIVRGGAGAGAKAIRYTKALFTWGREHGYLAANPAADVKAGQTNIRTRAFTAVELGRIATALAAVEAETPRLAVQIAALRLIAMTGLRKREVLRLRWQDVDHAAGLLRLPDAKGGARTVPVGAAVLLWIKALPVRHADVLFPGQRRKGALDDVHDAWDLVRAKAKLGGEGLNAAVVHSFRHTAVTRAIESGMSGPMIMALSGHKTPAMIARYSHVTPGSDPVRAAAAALAAPVVAALGAGAKIVPFPGGDENGPSAAELEKKSA